MSNRGIAIEINQTLVTEECCNCHMLFAVTQDFHQIAKDTGRGFYCPLGHCQSYSETTVMRLQKEKASLEQQLLMAKDNAVLEMKRREQVERQAKRVNKRIHNGVCPQCHRSFDNVRRHMATKHGEARAHGEP